MDSPLRPAREKLGVSQKDMARLVGVEPQTIGLYERNRMRPAPWRAGVIASAYGLTQDEVWAWILHYTRHGGAAVDKEPVASPSEQRLWRLERQVKELGDQLGLVLDALDSMAGLVEEVRLGSNGGAGIPA